MQYKNHVMTSLPELAFLSSLFTLGNYGMLYTYTIDSNENIVANGCYAEI